MTTHFEVPQAKVPALDERCFLQVGDKTLALFNVAHQLYAIDDSCPHQGASLCGGKLEGKVIQCCAHGLRFDLASGYLLNSTKLRVASYPVQKVGEQVLIMLDSGEQHE